MKDERKLGAAALAEIARAVAEESASSRPQTRFSVDHIRDRSGFLFSLLESEPGEGPRQTLSTSANGIGLVVLTAVAPEAATDLRPSAPALPVETKPDEDGPSRNFSGFARSNPTFIYEGGQALEGIIVIEDEPRTLTYGQCLRVREMVTLIATLASATFESPILSINTPSQAPAHTRDKRDLRRREDEWPRSQSLSVRFSVALKNSDADSRFRFLDALAARCNHLGHGMWMSDTRGGPRQGLWFGLAPHDRLLSRTTLPTVADRGGDRQVHVVVPLTIVGPARVGSTASIFAFLDNFPEAGVASCSVTALADLAFIHLQLVLNHASRRKLDAKSEELSRTVADALSASASGTISPALFLERYLPLATGSIGMGELAKTRALLDAKCFDYQVLAGPVMDIPSGKESKRLPVWTAWRIRGEQADLGHAMNSFQRALTSLGLESAGVPSLNMEYGICRSAEGGSMRGRAKWSIAESDVPGWTGTLADRARKFCQELETRWRAESQKEDSALDVSVQDREYRLSHWRSDT